MKIKEKDLTQQDGIAVTRFSRALPILDIGIFLEHYDTDLRDRFITSTSKSNFFYLGQAMLQIRDHSSYDHILGAYSDVLAVNNGGIKIGDELLIICSRYQNSDSFSGLIEEQKKFIVEFLEK